MRGKYIQLDSQHHENRASLKSCDVPQAGEASAEATGTSVDLGFSSLTPERITRNLQIQNIQTKSIIFTCATVDHDSSKMVNCWTGGRAQETARSTLHSTASAFHQTQRRTRHFSQPCEVRLSNLPQHSLKRNDFVVNR